MPLLKFTRKKNTSTNVECTEIGLPQFCFSQPQCESVELIEGDVDVSLLSAVGSGDDAVFVNPTSPVPVPTLVVEHANDVIRCESDASGDNSKGSADEEEKTTNSNSSSSSYFNRMFKPRSNSDVVVRNLRTSDEVATSPESCYGEYSDSGLQTSFRLSSVKKSKVASRRRDRRKVDQTVVCWHCEMQLKSEQRTRNLMLAEAHSPLLQYESSSESSSCSSCTDSDSDMMSDESFYSESSNQSMEECVCPPAVASFGMFLQVPSAYKHRSSSVDAAIFCVSTDISRCNSFDKLGVREKTRATSVDVNMPTDMSGKFEARPSSQTKSTVCQSNKPASSKAISSKNVLPMEKAGLPHSKHATGVSTQHEGSLRNWKSTVDWSENAINGEHLWVDTSSSGDFCYVGEHKCSKSGSKKKCAVCKIVIHIGCVLELEKMNFRCKQTFREANTRSNREGRREQIFIRHHWVHRRRLEGKCKRCEKSFQQKFPFNNKDIIAINCSWCKTAYHTKFTCFTIQHIEEQCNMGLHANIIVPPSWIIKSSKKISSSNKPPSSVRRRSQKNCHKRRKSSKIVSSASSASSTMSAAKAQSQTSPPAFVIKHIATPHCHPLLVFINPKSGGNQGSKLLRKFQWLLNPRQVFDLSVSDPKQCLEMFKSVPSLRILACGGDGTVGWILSTMIDILKITPCPPVAILPLGTGNDLARTLHWGPGYADESLSKILVCIEDGKVVQLDRWNLRVESNTHVESCGMIEQDSVSSSNGSAECGTATASPHLPLNVFNNYFSLGADAAVALEFHECREANPEKFNSRLRNKMFYAGAGGKSLLKAPWRELSSHVTLQCDGVDYTEKIRELRCHCLLFLNINKYGAGTMPWGNPTESMRFEPQRHDDGFLEVIGFTSTSLAALLVGGHGERLCQCRQVKLVTSKVIPVQVDGEPCRLLPSEIDISLLNQANMVEKPKRYTTVPPHIDDLDYGFGSQSSNVERLRLQISVVSMTDYEVLKYEKKRLRLASYPLGIIVIEQDSDLETVRKEINRLAQHTDLVTSNGNIRLSEKWLFLDSTTAERYFRIDRQQECLQYVTDVSNEDLHILDPELRVLRNSIPDSLVIKPIPQVALVENSANTTPPLMMQPPKNRDFECEAVCNSDNESNSSHSTANVLQPHPPSVPHPCVRSAAFTLLTKRRAMYLDRQSSLPEEKDLSSSCVMKLEAANAAVREGLLSSNSETSTLRRSFAGAKEAFQSSSCFPLDFDLTIARHHFSRKRHRIIKRHSLSDLLPIGQSDSKSQSNDDTALHVNYFSKDFLDACKQGALDRVRKLHKKGAALDCVDAAGRSGLHHAANYGHNTVVQFMVEFAPSQLLDVAEKEMGQTALHIAACKKHKIICHLLISAGASLVCVDQQGFTAGQRALQARDTELANLFDTR